MRGQLTASEQKDLQDMAQVPPPGWNWATPWPGAHEWKILHEDSAKILSCPFKAALSLQSTQECQAECERRNSANVPGSVSYCDAVWYWTAGFAGYKCRLLECGQDLFTASKLTSQGGKVLPIFSNKYRATTALYLPIVSAPAPTTGAPPALAASISPVSGSTAAGASVGASAIGDPHMRNMLGQKFDLMKPGEHTLIQIPRGASALTTYLHVHATAEREGSACADIYFKALNITGAWVDVHQKGGYAYVAEHPQADLDWRKFGKIYINVKWGHTLSGVSYLNVFVRNLSHAGYDVGGILGLDDYSDAAKPVPACAGVVTLYQIHRES